MPTNISEVESKVSAPSASPESANKKQPTPPADDTPMSDAPKVPDEQSAPTEQPSNDSVAEPLAKEKSAEPASTEDIVKAQTPQEDATKKDAVKDEALKEDVAMADAEEIGEGKLVASPAEATQTDVEMTGADAVADVAAAVANDSTDAPQAETQASEVADAPSMSNLAINETQESQAEAATADTSLTDAPSQSAKIAREREEDDLDDEPLAKRAKTEDAPDAGAATASTNAEVGAAPATETDAAAVAIDMPPRTRQFAPGSLADPAVESKPISQWANRELRNSVFSIVKKTKAGNNFKLSVKAAWPNLWDAYQARVPEPRDIGMIEQNLREDAYSNVGGMINDVFLLYENSIRFNGLNHDVTVSGKSLLDNIFARMSKLPATDPPRAEKKESKAAPTRHTEPRAATQRRESRGAPPAPAPAPLQEVIEASPATVAFPAGGTPIIRRDSTKVDSERPKRPVQPPKNRDLPYEVKNSKKKKAQPEMRFCEEVMRELTKSKNYDFNNWFMEPVDPVALQLPTYHKVIKKPMDLGTMDSKLRAGEYNTLKEFESDFSLIVKNTFKFNGDVSMGQPVSIAAAKLQELFDQKWKEKDGWIAAHAPPPPPASTSSRGDGGEDDSEDEHEASEPEAEIQAVPSSSATLGGLEARLAEETERFNQLLRAKVLDQTLISTQQTMIGLITTQIITEKTRLAEEEKRNKKPSKPKASKPKKPSGAAPAPAKKAAASGGAKKSGGGGGRKTGPKARVMGQAEKDIVSESINELDGTALDKAIDIIKKDTQQEVSLTLYTYSRGPMRHLADTSYRRVKPASLSSTSTSCLQRRSARSTI